MSIFLLFELSGCIYNILLMGIFIRGFFCLKDDVNKYLLFLSQVLFCIIDYSDAPEAPVRIVGKHLSGLRDALRQHICGEAALELHSDDSP